MLTRDDCIALSDLSEDEIALIANHEHCPDIIAAELGRYLVVTPEGRLYISAMIKDDLAAAEAKGDVRRVATLERVLHQFIAIHPIRDSEQPAA